MSAVFDFSTGRALLNDAAAGGITADGYYPSSDGFVPNMDAGQVFGDGTWDGASVAVETRGSGHTEWQSISGATFTDDGRVLFDIAQGDRLRLNVSGSGASTSLLFTLGQQGV